MLELVIDHFFIENDGVQSDLLSVKKVRLRAAAKRDMTGKERKPQRSFAALRSFIQAFCEPFDDAHGACCGQKGEERQEAPTGEQSKVARAGLRRRQSAHLSSKPRLYPDCYHKLARLNTPDKPTASSPVGEQLW